MAENAVSEPEPTAYLIIGVEEANGKLESGKVAWSTAPDPATGLPFEAFVKGEQHPRTIGHKLVPHAPMMVLLVRAVELRGGHKTIKAQTRKVPIADGQALLVWEEDLHLEVYDGANEVRVLLCREKFVNSKKGTAVIAACGIFLEDIVQVVPVDKFFELFKPSASGGEAGYIRIRLDYAPADAAEFFSDAPPAALEDAAAPAPVSAEFLAAAETVAVVAAREALPAGPPLDTPLASPQAPKQRAPAAGAVGLRRRVALVALGVVAAAAGIAVLATRPKKAKNTKPAAAQPVSPPVVPSPSTPKPFWL